MADFTFNPEKSAVVVKEPARQSFSPAHFEGYQASGSALKVAESTGHVLPLLVICPDGNVAGRASTKADVARLSAECREKT